MSIHELVHVRTDAHMQVLVGCCGMKARNKSINHLQIYIGKLGRYAIGKLCRWLGQREGRDACNNQNNEAVGTHATTETMRR